MNKLLLAALCCISSLFGASVTDSPDPGQIHFMMRTWTNFNQYTHQATPANQAWLKAHMWRMQESYGYFDPELSWYPNAWAYVDSSASHTDSAIVAQHPDWVLKDAKGNKLYVPYACSGGKCSQYAMDFSNPAYRLWWIAMAQGVVARGYKGLWIDDVNLEERTSNGNGSYVQPIDPRTGKAMPLATWRKYFADFMVQVRSALPTIEILHNQIYWDGSGPLGTDPDVQREIKSADWINRERGVSQGIDQGGTGAWSLRGYLSFVDQVHALGSNVDIQEFDFSGDYGPACYFLISSGMDAFGNDAIITTNWPANYDVKLGAPQGSRYEWNGVIRRDFANGSVFVVAPGDPSVSVSLGGGYTDVSGKSVSAVKLSAKQGLILLHSGTPVPPVVPSGLAPGTYVVTNLLSSMVIDDPGASKAVGQGLIQWSANNTSNQSWKFVSDGSGGYTIQSVCSGLYLTDVGGAVQQTSSASSWTVKASGSGFIIASKATGRVLDDSGASIVAGTPIITWSANGGRNQVWSIK